ncbi:MAG: L,D-transpeptidase family protein, partial [Finegoldia magna]
DSDKLKETLKNSELFKNIKEPKNAQLIFENKKAIIKPEELGNKLDLDKVCESVIKGFNEHKDEIKLSSEYINPQVTKKSLEPNKKELENIAKASITLKLPNGESQKIEDNSIFLDENYKFEDKKVRIFVDDLKEKFEVVGKDFDFTTHNGKSIKVKAKVFGNEINKKQTVALITDALKNGKTIDSDLVYSRRSRNNGVLGKSYIEISLGSQHLWYFKDGKLVLDTPVVTGDPSIDHETPTGLFEIWSKETDRFLRGFNPDGSKYKVHVDYWMQIDYTGVGIHDTKGRAAYGGQIFNGAGSHGCINTPINHVRTIFNSAENGMPVVIY